MQEAQGGKEKECKKGNARTEGKCTERIAKRRVQVCKGFKEGSAKQGANDKRTRERKG
jgi:hypothetical protein